MTFRLGSALILIGLLMLVIFLLSMSVQQLDLRLLLGGAALGALGLLLHRHAARSQPPPTRFRLLRRVLGHEQPPPHDDKG